MTITAESLGILVGHPIGIRSVGFTQGLLNLRSEPRVVGRSFVRPALPLSGIWPAAPLDKGLCWRPRGRVDLDLSHPYFVEDGDGLCRIAESALLLTPFGC